MAKGEPSSALAEAFYWMAEKQAWGYEEVKPNLGEALKLFKQAADLGFSDAYIRIGELQEHGKGTARDVNAAIRSYAAAAKTGNVYALAFLAKLLSRGSQREKADKLWDQFFKALSVNPQSNSLAASRGEVLHDYISTQLALGLEPRHRSTLFLYRLEIAAHHQRVLDHSPKGRFLNLRQVLSWIHTNLGPWPTGD